MSETTPSLQALLDGEPDDPVEARKYWQTNQSRFHYSSPEAVLCVSRNREIYESLNPPLTEEQAAAENARRAEQAAQDRAREAANRAEVLRLRRAADERAAAEQAEQQRVAEQVERERAAAVQAEKLKLLENQRIYGSGRGGQQIVTTFHELIDIKIKPRDDWEQLLIKTGERGGKGAVPQAIQVNIAWTLAACPSLSGKLWYDEFAHQIVIRGKLPWSLRVDEREWTDYDRDALIQFCQAGSLLNANQTITRGAVNYIARQQSYHPVADYLSKVIRIDTPLLDEWLVKVFGCEANEYTRQVGRKFLIGMVRRIRWPGEKFDNVLLLFGEQDLKKSMALRELTAPWYTDEIADLGSKDCAMQMRGIWLIEMAELESLSRIEATRAKAFFSRSFDRFRPPYGESIIKQLRQCGFAGTTNEDKVLKDTTGNRRYWNLNVTKLADVDWLVKHRDALWAEAVVAEAGQGDKFEPHWLDDDAVKEQAKRVAQSHTVEDMLLAPISTWLNSLEGGALVLASGSGVGVHDVAHRALDIKDRTKWDRALEMRISACLKRLGLEGRHTTTGTRYHRKHEIGE